MGTTRREEGPSRKFYTHLEVIAMKATQFKVTYKSPYCGINVADQCPDNQTFTAHDMKYNRHPINLNTTRRKRTSELARISDSVLYTTH